MLVTFLGQGLWVELPMLDHTEYVLQRCFLYCGFHLVIRPPPIALLYPKIL